MSKIHIALLVVSIVQSSVSLSLTHINTHRKSVFMCEGLLSCEDESTLEGKGDELLFRCESQCVWCLA